MSRTDYANIKIDNDAPLPENLSRRPHRPQQEREEQRLLPAVITPTEPVTLAPIEPFNYDQLDAALAAETRNRAARIKSLHHRTVEAIMEIGREMAQAKEALAHGHFMDWVEHEFTFSQSTANNHMHAARAFAGRTCRPNLP